LSSSIDRRSALRVAASALAFRLLSAVLALLINIAFPLDAPRQATVYATPSTFWDTFARYDSGWYEGIARNGYQYAPGGRSNIAYFPVYPMLMRQVGRIFGRYHAAFYFGGIVVSWTSFVLATVALYYLARLDLPRHRAERAVLLTAIFPFAFFFGVIYSESTFLLFTVLAFYLFRARRAGHCDTRHGRADVARARVVGLEERRTDAPGPRTRGCGAPDLADRIRVVLRIRL